MDHSRRQPTRRHGFAHAWAALISVTAVAGACGADTAAEGEPHTTVDSAGIEIVESRAPRWGDEARRIDPEPFLRIGEVDGERPYRFGSLSDAVLLSDGHIAVSDAMANEVRLFDPAGRHVRTFGGPGEGPGEFGRVVRIWEQHGDSIAAFDARLYRTTVFSRSSGLHRTVRNPMEGNFVVFGVLRDGPVLLFNPGQFRRDLSPGLQWDSSDVIAMDPSGESYEAVARLPVLERLIGQDGRRQLLIPRATSIRATAEDGFYWSTPGRYEISFYDADGELRRILRRPVEPRRVDDTALADFRDAYLARYRRFEGEEALPRYERLFEDATYRETIPLFGAALVDAGQRLWASEWVFPYRGEPPRRWSVFSPDGIWLGDLEAPDRFGVTDSRGDVVLGIWRDELDVPYVQMHRITGG